MSYAITYFTSGMHEKEHCTTILHFLHIPFIMVQCSPSHVFLLLYTAFIYIYIYINIYIYIYINCTTLHGVLIAVIW